MNRDFVYDHPRRASRWSRVVGTLSKWLWGAVCCGLPGIPCFYCTCCEKVDEARDTDLPCVHRATATTDRLSLQRRPHAPRGRKTSPETLSAVRCALSQLQREPAPPVTDPGGKLVLEPG